MKSNNKMQLIEPWEICIPDEEFLDEIVELYEYATEIEVAIYDLESQIVELKQELYSIYPNLIRKKSS